MTLVPGVAGTNAVRDIISGDLVAGSSKLVEAAFIAIALALGVWLVMETYVLVFGTVLPV